MTDLEILLVVQGVAIGALLVYSKSYATEKGKNLAIREDLDTVTRAVEQIRVEAQGVLEREKSALAHAELVNRTQYEQELAAYRAVWTALFPVQRAAMALRPVFDHAPGPGETEASRKQARLKTFAESFAPFSEAVWLHRPFYPEDVFGSLTELLRLMNSEAIAYHRFDPHREDYWDKAEDSVKAINSQVDSIASAIRQRLSRVRVA